VEFLLASIACCLELGFLGYSIIDYEYLRFATVVSVFTYRRTRSVEKGKGAANWAVPWLPNFN
jgi:hypothetical protein